MFSRPMTIIPVIVSDICTTPRRGIANNVVIGCTNSWNQTLCPFGTLLGNPIVNASAVIDKKSDYANSLSFRTCNEKLQPQSQSH